MYRSDHKQPTPYFTHVVDEGDTIRVEVDGNVLALWHNEEYCGIAYKSELFYEEDVVPFIRIRQGGLAMAVLQGSVSPQKLDLTRGLNIMIN